MQMSGEYGTELLIRYTDEQLQRDLERRRIANERQADAPKASRPHGSIGGRLAALFRAHSDERMPSRRRAGVVQVHAAHR